PGCCPLARFRAGPSGRQTRCSRLRAARRPRRSRSFLSRHLPRPVVHGSPFSSSGFLRQVLFVHWWHSRPCTAIVYDCASQERMSQILLTFHGKARESLPFCTIVTTMAAV